MKFTYDFNNAKYSLTDKDAKNKAYVTTTTGTDEKQQYVTDSTAHKLMNQYVKTIPIKENRIRISDNYLQQEQANKNYNTNPYVVLSTNSIYDMGIFKRA